MAPRKFNLSFLSPEMRECLWDAKEEARTRHHMKVRCEHVLFAMLHHGQVDDYLAEHEIDRSWLLDSLTTYLEEKTSLLHPPEEPLVEKNLLKALERAHEESEADGESTTQAPRVIEQIAALSEVTFAGKCLVDGAGRVSKGHLKLVAPPDSDEVVDEPNGDPSKMRRSIERIDEALARLDSVLSDDGEVVDEAYAEGICREVFEDDARPYVVRQKGGGTKTVQAYFESRFGTDAPADLKHLLRHMNGMWVVDGLDAVDGCAPDSNLWLDASQMVDHAEWHRDYVTNDDRELPTFPLTSAWPGGPSLALWVDDSEPPYRIVTYDHETSSDGYLPVVAESLGDAFSRYVDEHLAVLNLDRRVIENIDVDASDAPQEREPIIRDEPPPPEPSPAEKMELVPLDFSTEELVEIWRDTCGMEGRPVVWAQAWSTPLAAHRKNDPERAEQREHLLRAGLVAAQRFPDRSEAIERMMKFRYGFPADDEEAGWSAEITNAEEAGIGGDNEDEYWVPPRERWSYVDCLLMSLIPGMGHWNGGQKAKGVLIFLVVLMSLCSAYLLVPLIAYDLYLVARAADDPDYPVGKWTTFPTGANPRY